MGHAVLQPLRVGLSRFAAYMNWRVLKDQPYGVGIEPLIRGSVDAVHQHCPAKRLTPMGLFVDVWSWKRDDEVCTWRLKVKH